MAFLLQFNLQLSGTVGARMEERFIESALSKEDQSFEVPLRPQALSDFVGQDKVKERLDILLQAAKSRQDALRHCLFLGPPGLGKTTLANILAKEMGAQIVATTGPSLERAADLAGLLTSLEEGDVLFIDEIHRIPRAVEEYLYPAMEDFSIDIMVDSGPSARSVNLSLKPFTLVGATTRVGLLSAPLRSRFGISLRLDYYSPEILAKVLQRSANILHFTLDDETALEVAKRARGTPRIANNLLRWVRDFAQIRANGTMSPAVVTKALAMLAIDRRGLDEMDKKILQTIMESYQGGPVGLNTLAVAVGEEKTTLEEVYEPYLIMQGFIKRTPRGRELTPLAYEHMGKNLEESKK